MVRIIVILSFLLQNVYGTNYHIQPLGSDNNVGTSFTKAFKTIQKATNLAKAGDSILVYNGMYKGWDHYYKNSGTIGKPIVYFAKGNNVIINRSCGRGFDGVNVEGSDWIEIQGFRVQSIADLSGTAEDGIRVLIANHVSVRNCIIDSCYRGIFAAYTYDFIAENNICMRSYGEHGIYVSNSSDRVIIRNNECYNNKAAGIQINPDPSSGTLGLSYEVWIYNNICHNNNIGLNLIGIIDSWIYNNLLYDNGSNNEGNGVTLLGDAVGCQNVRFFHNTILVPSNSQWAIFASECDSLFIFNNILLSNSEKGSFDIESSCKDIFSDYNALNDKITLDQGRSYISFNTWQQLGQDQHSILIADNATVFKNAGSNFNLVDQSILQDKGLSLYQPYSNFDLIGTSRPQGKAPDIGCYETQVSNQISEEYKRLDLESLIRMAEKESIIFVWNELSGRQVKSENGFSMANLAKGIYILNVQHKSNHILGSFKIFVP